MLPGGWGRCGWSDGGLSDVAGQVTGLAAGALQALLLYATAAAAAPALASPPTAAVSAVCRRVAACLLLLDAAAHGDAGGGHPSRQLVSVGALLRLPRQLGVLGIVMYLQQAGQGGAGQGRQAGMRVEVQLPGGLLVGAPWAAGHRLGGSTATARLPAAAPCPPHLHRLEVRRLLAADVAPAAGGEPGVARATSTPVLAPAGGSRGTTAAPAPHMPALGHRAGTAALSTEGTHKPGQEPTLEQEQKQ